MFAIEHYGVAADLYTLAKSLGGGFPLSAVVGRAEVMDACGPGGLGGTYAGNPVACAAALAVLEIFDQERIFERAERLGEKVAQTLDAMASRHSEIVDVRRLGAMIAFELCEGGDPRRPAADLTKKLTARSRELGLILLSCGIYGNVVRILVPITAEDAVVDEGLGILAKAASELLSDANETVPRLRPARGGEARRAMPRLPSHPRAVRHSRSANARAGHRAGAGGDRRLAFARAAEARRADGAVEPADADQPAPRRGSLQHPAVPPAQLAPRAYARVRASARALMCISPQPG